MPDITVNVNAKNLDVGANATMSRDEAVEVVKDIVRRAATLCPHGAASGEVVLVTEGSKTDPVQKVKIKLVLDGRVVTQSSHSRSIKNALERAENDLDRQVRKLKTKKTDKRQQDRRKNKIEASKEIPFDELRFDD